MRHKTEFLLITGTLAAVGGVAMAALFAPSLMFLAGVPLVNDNPQQADLCKLQEAAITIRTALTSSYFNWAVLSMSICGAVVWRSANERMDLYKRTIIVVSFILSSMSILAGVTFLELSALAVSLGAPLVDSDSPFARFPDIQFAATASGFLLAVVAATVEVVRPKPTRWRKP